MKIKRSQVSLLFKLLSTGLILFLLFRAIQFNTEVFLGILSTIKIPWLILSLGGVIVVLAIKSYRWNELLSNQGIKYGYLPSVKAYFSAYAVGVVSPGRLGEFVKVYNVRQDTGSGFLPAFKTTMGDRLFDLALLFLFSIAGGMKYMLGINLHDFYYLFASTFIIAFLIFIFNFLFKTIRTMQRFSGNILIAFIADCLYILAGWRSWLAWLLTAVAYACYFLTSWFLFKALEINIGIIETGYVISIVGLVLLLPVSIAGFGTREISLVFLLANYGIDNEVAISFSILHFVSFFVWGGLVGLTCWIAKPVSLKILKEDTQRVFNLFRKKKPFPPDSI